jgi:hypothetical protein
VNGRNYERERERKRRERGERGGEGNVRKYIYTHIYI